ncbi:RNA polymerase II transcription factor B subunit 4 [Cyberlindnera fabianii]|uniref:General transcription and DNA repair factor IIH subunit TFB4 n=1 Tax=Cyberlindnera fabianii TaxID=36022 RepID=A0A1V2LDR4_CYBFA|nr:RNA polymerase II transcription factor B subunit 4 [Cyberlindnera fabianii]
MEAIADKAFTTEAPQKALTAQWHQLGDKKALRKVLESLTIAMNAHISLNNANRVAIIASHSDGARFIYPAEATHASNDTSRTVPPPDSTEDTPMPDTANGSKSTTPEPKASTSKFVSSQMYRQFKVVDDAFFENVLSLFTSEIPSKPPRNSLSSSLSHALAYINKTQNIDPAMKARILIVNVSPDEHIKYIPIMNCIFAAQKMKIPINVCQLSGDATFLQQAADATSGVYLHIEDIDGLVQYFSTAFFVDPSLKSILIKPTSGNIDFRASCFKTGKVVDIGYVCSVCLCILSEVPEDEKCPACDSEFDPHVIKKLKRRPAVGKRKKKKVDGVGVSATPTPGPTAPGTPARGA